MCGYDKQIIYYYHCYHLSLFNTYLCNVVTINMHSWKIKAIRALIPTATNRHLISWLRLWNVILFLSFYNFVPLSNLSRVGIFMTPLHIWVRAEGNVGVSACQLIKSRHNYLEVREF